MIHPDTNIRYINGNIGVGVFATAFIPKGTITYIKDKLELMIKPDDPIINDPDYAELVDKYSFIDGDGTRVISWDHAKYVNHCCECNTISTGYGFEIAIKDINEGEQITDEYGLFNVDYKMTLECSNGPCRKTLSPDDIDRYSDKWDEKVKSALQTVNNVQQPLMRYLDPNTKKELNFYLKTGSNYKSVLSLKYLQPRAKSSSF